VRAFIRRLERHGWRVRRSKRSSHLKLKPPDGGPFLVLSATPANGGWRRPTEAKIKRAGFAEHLTKGGR
jgi:hypothetical protein